MSEDVVTDPIDWIKSQEARRAAEYRTERIEELQQEIGDYTLALANITEVLDTGILERQNEIDTLQGLIDGGDDVGLSD